MEMSIIECIFECLGAFFICISFCSIGRIFISGKNLALQALIGMSVISIPVIVCMSFCAVLAKYIIYIAICISVLLSIYMLIRNWNNKKEIIKSFLPVFLMFLYFSIRLFMWITPETGTFDFNCHETYFAAPSLEIFKADYFSRLRIIDVYPYEWSGYHFFNGAFTAIPFVAFVKKNYITFLFVKFLTISVLLGSIFGCVKEKYAYKKAVFYFIIGCISAFVLSYNLVTWSSFTNNYSSLLLMYIVWLVMQEEDWRISCIISLILAVSTSRATLTGGLFFLYSLYMLFSNTKEKSIISFIVKEKICAICCMILGLGSVVMLLSGKQPYGQSVFSLDCMGNMFNMSWLQLMPFGTFFTNLTVLPKDGAVYQVHFEVLVFFVYTYVLLHNYKKIKNFLLKNWKLIFVVIIFMAEICFVYTVKSYGLNIKRYIFILVAFSCLYLFPISSIYAASDSKMSVRFSLFIISSLMQYMVFMSGTSCVNYALIVPPLILCFIKQISIDINTPKSCFKICAMCFSVLGALFFFHYNFHYSFFCSPNDYYSTQLELRESIYSDEPYECVSEEYADFAKLNAIKGNRVQYSSTPDIKNIWMAKNSMTMRFLTKNYKEISVQEEK